MVGGSAPSRHPSERPVAASRMRRVRSECLLLMLAHPWRNASPLATSSEHSDNPTTRSEGYSQGMSGLRLDLPPPSEEMVDSCVLLVSADDRYYPEEGQGLRWVVMTAQPIVALE
jgi:hypothetical protein